MSNLEAILEIGSSIRRQKRKQTSIKRDNVLLLEDNMELKVRVKTSINEELADDLPKKIETHTIDEYTSKPETNGLLSNLYHSIINKMYEYAAAAKNGFKKVIEDLRGDSDNPISGGRGYTDKLLKEVEDWGMPVYRTAFHNLRRVSPLGAAARYLQEMWVCMVKTIK